MSRTPSPEVLIQQINKLQNEKAVLDARLKILKKTDPLLEEIALSLLLADEASDPARTTPIMDQKVSGSRRPPEPGAHVRQARNAARILRKNLEDAIRRFHIAAEHNWSPPPLQRDPQVRCCNRKCEAKDKRLPKYVGPRGASRVELSNCPKCSMPLVEA